MENISINFFNEDVVFSLPSPSLVSAWIMDIIHAETFSLLELNFIFCSDSYLLELNRHYLDHDFYTDIITFDNSDISNSIEGDIFISIDRIADNAKLLELDFIDELHRILAHGVLHLIGFSDKVDKLASLMRQKEDYYLSLRKF